jgi:hypothetical protein
LLFGCLVVVLSEAIAQVVETFYLHFFECLYEHVFLGGALLDLS